jgi:amino acid adenylation domain-containing protein
MENNSYRTGLCNAERQQWELWNNTRQPYPRDRGVHQLVSRQAGVAPEALALADGPSVMTYGELERESNCLAHYLRFLGVSRDILVGLSTERSPMMVVAALAILKAGGAYVPMDPSYPPERIAFMLDDAQPRVLITQSDIARRLPIEGRQVVVLDHGLSQIANQPSHAPADFGTTDDLAYVIYTSGSTGQPKGVQVTHGGLLNLIFWHQHNFGITPADRATQLASLGFDAAVWELWPYLTAGASVHFVADLVRTQPERLRDWLVEHEISISFVPTPLAERMLHLDWPAKTALRTMLTGADVLHHYPPANVPFLLVNNYGPTECTVVATSGPVPQGACGNRLPPIGRPIANTQIHILDQEVHAVPMGAAGELHIAGAGLARGYLNQPDLTRQKFISNPFSEIAGDRLYKTGDLARFLPDGQVEFLGRIDDLVKIRGYRIELNEIVSVLSRHPGVRESTVVAKEDWAGDKRLVAYIVPAADRAPTLGDLRNFLSKELPEYMLPAAFVTLHSLPIGPNGKVDRSALPAPDDQNTVREDRAFLGPRTPTEKRIASIVAPLLGLERVSVNDNFFTLGGNSLLGTQVIARLREAFGVELSLLTLFDHPTVAGIAGEAERLLVAKLDAMSEEEVQRLLDVSTHETQA